MLGKGIVKFFLIALTVVCLIQFLFMLPTRNIENAAHNYAVKMASTAAPDDKLAVEKAARIKYLDSMSSEEVFSIPLLKKYTYQDLKRQQLALGLDLKGGMSVLLQVDLKDLILSLSNNSKDANFLKAIASAEARQTNSQSDFVTLFAEEFAKVGNGTKLASIFSRNQSLQDVIKFNTPDAEVVRILREKANETVKLTYQRLKDRIDEFGVTQPNVSLDAARDLIVVELPGVDNPERARNLLSATAKLEFWDAYRISDGGLINAFMEADKRIKDKPVYDKGETLTDSTKTVESIAAVTDTTKKDTTKNALNSKGPLLSILNVNGAGGANSMFAGYAVLASADKNQIEQINKYLARPDVSNLFPNDLLFRWSAKPIKNATTGEFTKNYELYGIRKRKTSDKAPLEGDHITRAASYPDPTTGQILVTLNMDNQGARIWGDMTTKAAQDNNREVAIVLDDKVVSAPRVNDAILSGSTQISGSFTVEEGKDLASILEIGKLPAKTKIIQESLVGPSLGEDNINKSMTSILIALLLMVIFMIAYYNTSGIPAVIAMFLNLFLLIGAMASLGTVMTLPGIAGILLTLAIAIDANVIIYERVREELREGKPLLASIKDGFIHSYPPIIDANVTSLITALVLNFFGLGPIKGFAIVLIIGIITTLFTAMLVTHLFVDYWTINKGKDLKFSHTWSEKIMTNVHVNWMGIRKYGYMFSGIITLICIVSFFTRGFELGVDFKGGYSYNVKFDKPIELEPLRVALTKSFGSTPVVKAVDTENTYNITTSYLINDQSNSASEKVMAKLYEGISNVEKVSTLEDFKSSDSKGTHIASFSKVGPTVADDIQNSSLISTVLALILIFVYMFVRFTRWQFSFGAVVALLHDVIITIGLFSLLHGFVPFSLEIDQAVIAAILTVIGYSVNDTVIVFDRIREFIKLYAGKPKEEVFNLAINNTLSRTMITSGITFTVCLILFIFGGSSIKGFAFALMIGVGFGTYSSVFVASAIANDMIKDEVLNAGNTVHSHSHDKSASHRNDKVKA
ncbi:MAG: protein translocase subunit SecDF [Saprospiraceae bacterium]|nr:protein translocase subunit SecDF [Saprospiraceae bacterium]